MTGRRISELPTVVTPVGTDEFVVNQGGVSRKVLLDQLITNSRLNAVFAVMSVRRLEINGGDSDLVYLSSANVGLELRSSAAEPHIYIDFTKSSTSIVGSGVPDSTSRIRFVGANNNLLFERFNNIGIGIPSPTFQFQLSLDSAAKPSTSTWTVVSDKRLKKSIELANLDLCYNAVKSIPLWFYRWKDNVYTVEQVRDRGKLGWIADDVEKVYPKAVNTIPFELLTEVLDGEETIEEPVYDEVERTETYIEVIDGQPIQKTKTIIDRVQRMELRKVLDENNKVVLDAENRPIMHAVPVMQTIARAKTRKERIEDCKSVNHDQVYAAMYGAVQKLIQKVEKLEAKIYGTE